MTEQDGETDRVSLASEPRLLGEFQASARMYLKENRSSKKLKVNYTQGIGGTAPKIASGSRSMLARDAAQSLPVE